MRQIPRPQIREVGIVLAIIAALVLIMVTIGHQAQQIAGLRGQYETLHAQYEGLYDEALQKGVDPEAPAPEDVPDVDGAEPEVQTPDPVTITTGPSDDQVVAAVAAWCSTHDCVPRPTMTQVADALADYCAANRCRGADGEDSTVPGPGPTTEQIATGVAAYCADGACRGEDGDDATPLTAEQIQAAITAYCDARDQCRGPGGEDGTDGTDGKDGRGIVDVECRTAPDLPNDGGDWIYTWTDGTTTTVEGPCRVVTPTPTPTPTTMKGR